MENKKGTINEFAVVLPSYNEVKNVSVLIKRIRKALLLSKIIIVDDSPVEENAKLKRAIKNYKNVKLISRLEKKGRGSAVLEGFKQGLRDKSIKYFFEMDSDLAQDPKEFKRFIKKMFEENADLVVGSRYIPGGKIVGVSISRIILSKIINKFLYVWLGAKLTDFTDGFRLYKRNAVQLVLNETIESTGFITLSETVYKLNKKGIRIEEVPVTIYSRKQGISTMNLKELFVSLLFVFKMRVNDLKDNFKII